jgi:hypothetical protein
MTEDLRVWRYVNATHGFHTGRILVHAFGEHFDEATEVFLDPQQGSGYEGTRITWPDVNEDCI